ncbi:unnamed protein product [Mytilus edulis]|uniref:Uncharacterized protein n=1 Tax=Mytilus edulis TaxID=6550 RepID=A0A8S3QDY9_MYTED|nr:unnamed protein product [Mytilus edulis]
MAESDCFESVEESSSVGRGYESDFSTRENTSTEESFTQAQTPVKYNLPVSVSLRQQLNIKKSDYENGTDIHHIPLSYKPDYITEIDSNTVAVSCRDNNTILIINISTRSVTSTIKTSGSCWGISYNDNNLYVVIGGSIIHVMDLTGKVIRTIPIPSYGIHDITVDRDRLVCIDNTSIYCCSLDGKLMWEFENDKFQDLTCVTTDNEGNVYVTYERRPTL